MREHEAWDGDDLPDPWEGDHDIEYWVWREDRLVPAASDDLARIQEEERTREALFRLEHMQVCERKQAQSLMRRLSVARLWGSGHVRVAVQWLLTRRRHGLAPHTENARAERSSTR